MGGLEALPNIVVPYFADYCTEVIFHVTTLMTSSTPENRKKLVTKDYVVIVWAEDDVDSYNFDNSQFKVIMVTPRANIKTNDVQIVIHPQSSGLYRVRIVSKVKEVIIIGNADVLPLFVEGI
jgi:hypothetical protein